MGVPVKIKEINQHYFDYYDNFKCTNNVASG